MSERVPCYEADVEEANDFLQSLQADIHEAQRWAIDPATRERLNDIILQLAEWFDDKEGRICTCLYCGHVCRQSRFKRHTESCPELVNLGIVKPWIPQEATL